MRDETVVFRIGGRGCGRLFPQHGAAAFVAGRRRTLIPLASIVLMSCVSQSACSARTPADSQATDLAEIRKLHRLDVEATLAGDQEALAEGMTDDVVILQQGREPEIGRDATLEARRKNARPGFRVLSYVPEIQDITIADGWACEWGYFTASFVDSPGGQEKRLRGKLLRVLEKQPNGSWKYARAMWNTSE